MSRRLCCLPLVAGLMFARTGPALAEPPAPRSEPLCLTCAGEVYAAAFAPDGKLLAAGESGMVHLWDAATGKERRRLQGHQAAVLALAFAPDGRLLATAGADNTVRLWDVPRGKERVRFAGHHAGAVAFAPDGKTLATGNQDGTVSLWEVASGQEVGQFRGHRQRVAAVAFAPDGALLASASLDRTLRLWETSTAREIRSFATPRTGFWGAGFTADGKLLAGIDGWGVRLWEVATGREVRRFPGRLAFALAPDGQSVASLVYPGYAVCLWSVASGKEQGRFEGHTAWVRAFAFSRDGKRLASGGQDHSVRVWDVSGLVAPGPAEPSRRLAQQRVPAVRQLTPGEVDACWRDLGGADGLRAYRALRTLAAAPAQAVPFLSERLHPAPAAEAARVAQLIRDLDDDRFAVRERAMRELRERGEAVLPALRRALEDRPPLETRQRIEQLLERQRGPVPAGDGLRALRAVEVLEQIGTPEACRILKTLAGGAPDARLTQEAQAALGRLARSAGGAKAP